MFLFSKRKWPEIPLEEIRKRARILVIDDSEFFYLSLFKNDGYIIEKWDDVNDLPKLESGYYDIIFLDIQGVGKEQSADQGFGILKHLREVNPAQIIIAYSNADWPVKYHDFFSMADAVLPKSGDYVDFKRTLDRLLNDKFSLGFYLSKIANAASPYLTDTEKINNIAQKSILSGNLVNLKKYADKYVDNKEAISLILQIAQFAITLAAAL